MNEGHIMIRGEINPDMIDYVDNMLRTHAGKETIVVHIASPGGSVYAGYNIYHLLKNSGKKVRTIIEGEAQSMATFIAQAGDIVEICNPSVFMIHNPSAGVQGTAEQFEQGASELRNIEDDMVAAYVARTGLEESKIRDMMRKETRLNAQQAVDMGFADKILNTYMRTAAFGKQKTEEEEALEQIKIMLKVSK